MRGVYMTDLQALACGIGVVVIALVLFDCFITYKRFK